MVLDEERHKGQHELRQMLPKKEARVWKPVWLELGAQGDDQLAIRLKGWVQSNERRP